MQIQEHAPGALIPLGKCLEASVHLRSIRGGLSDQGETQPLNESIQEGVEGLQGVLKAVPLLLVMEDDYKFARELPLGELYLAPEIK